MIYTLQDKIGIYRKMWTILEDSGIFEHLLTYAVNAQFNIKYSL